jgi:putative transposase
MSRVRELVPTQPLPAPWTGRGGSRGDSAFGSKLPRSLGLRYPWWKRFQTTEVTRVFHYGRWVEIPAIVPLRRAPRVPFAAVRGLERLTPPPSSGVTKLTDARLAYLVDQAQRGWDGDTLPQMAARWAVTRRWLRKLLQRWRDSGVVPRLNPNRRPKGPPLTPEQLQLIVAEWERAPRGATQLWKALARRGVHLPHAKVHAYLRQQGWSVPNPRKQKPRRRCRYERDHSGSLLHADYHRTTEAHPHCILWLDDASRMILSGGEFAEATSEHAIETLAEALEVAARWNLTVREVNTDRGAQFYANRRLGADPGLGRFQRFLGERGIRHVVSRVNNPETNGKAERLWLEYDKLRWRFPTLRAWIDWKNDEVHGALWDLETPREAFQRKLPPETLLGLHLERVEAIA